MRQLNLLAILVFMIIAPTSALAQCSQDVLVLLYRGDKPKKPLANVSVIASNAGSTTTDNNGRCTLKFKTLTPGDKVTIRRIERPGYEIFNKEILDYWYVSRTNEPFVILMCESKYIKKLRDEYRKGATSTMQKDLTQQESRLSENLKSGVVTKEEYDRKIKQLRNDYEAKLFNIESFIDHLAHADFSVIDETEKHVFDLVKKGDILGAAEEYEKINLVANYAKEVKAKAKLTDDIEKLNKALDLSKADQTEVLNRIKRQVSLLRIIGGKENIEKTYKLYDDLLKADTTNFEIAHDYALYLIRSKKRNEAKKIVKYCLNSNDYYDKIRTASLQARIMYNENDWEEEVKFLEPVYEQLILESIVNRNSEHYLKERCIIADQLSNAFISLRDTIKAAYYVEKAMADALLQYDKMYNNETKRQLVEAYNTAFMYSYRFDIDITTGIKMIEEAISLQEELYKAETSYNAALLAFLHEHIGAMYLKMERNDAESNYFTEIVKHFQLACDLYEEAYKYNPIAYLSYLPEAFKNLGNAFITYNNHRDLEKAKLAFDKCEFYLDNYANKEMLEYTKGLAAFYLSIIEYYILLEDYNQALDYALKAEKCYLELYAKNPKTYKKSIVYLYKKMVLIYSQEPTKNDEKIKETKEKLETIK